MNKCYNLILLSEVIETLGEDSTQAILSNFSCIHNKDVESFIKNRAIEFSKKGIAATHLIFNDNRKLIAYFTLTLKTINIKEGAISKNLIKKISKYGVLDTDSNSYQIPSILIAQLGKNFTDNMNTQIEGSDLMELAIEKIKSVQKYIGGKITYIECEDKEKLVEFYEKNGFRKFNERKLDSDESREFDDDKYLNQMIAYIN